MDNKIKEMVDNKSFFGLVTRKAYEDLLKLHFQIIDYAKNLLDSNNTRAALMERQLEVMKEARNNMEANEILREDLLVELNKYVVLNDTYQWLYANGHDINYADFVMCATQQQDDSELFNNMIDISKFLRGENE
jgi:hypothetical protein